ncbi:MAG: hypothetical protein ACJAXX_002969, partial [Roseivirga sp.]
MNIFCLKTIHQKAKCVSPAYEMILLICVAKHFCFTLTGCF